MRAACRHWLQVAARCKTPSDVWPERLLKLYQADQYGARDELLRCASLLLDEQAQRALIARFESQLAQALGAPPCGESPSLDVFRISAALSLLAESLRDPDIMVRATLRFSQNPNPLQRQALVRACHKAERPADALAWLQEIAGSGGNLLLPSSHEDFEAEIRARHGRKSAFWAYVNGTRINGHDKPAGITSQASAGCCGRS